MSIPVKTIAGQRAGIPVTINADLYPLFQAIDSAAKQGNHWARICVAELRALSSGHIRPSVFIKTNGRHDDVGEFSIILPGCRASFRKNNAGMFYIYAFEADTNYLELQKSYDRPGLFNVKKDNAGKWADTLVSSGKLVKRDNNVVVVSDRAKKVPDAAKFGPEAIKESGQASNSALEYNGFNLHFTPGNTRIGGLRNIHQAYNSSTHQDLHESARLLADTMESAKGISQVTWVSERGGSGVLTQAMRILKDRGVNFEGSGHKAFFSNIQTNLGTAESLARDLKLKFDGKSHSKHWYNLNHRVGSGVFGGFIDPIRRTRNDDKYTTLNCIRDMGKEAGALGASVGAAMAVPGTAKALGAAAIGIGTSLAAATTPAGFMFAAATAGYAAYKAASPVYNGASAVINSYFPNAAHKKLTGQ